MEPRGDDEEYLQRQQQLEMKRMNAKHVREQEHHKHTILKTAWNQFFEQKKITFWDGDNDNGEWRKDVTQCSPVDEIAPYGEKGKKISGVIAKHFVLEESRIKRD